VFESTCLMDKVMCSRPVPWNAIKRITISASADEPRALFHNTDTQFHRIQI